MVGSPVNDDMGNQAEGEREKERGKER